jgi:hypothetical protein
MQAPSPRQGAVLFLPVACDHVCVQGRMFVSVYGSVSFAVREFICYRHPHLPLSAVDVYKD